MLTIYALAHDSSSTEDVYISLHDKVRLYIKLTDDLGKTLVEQSVTSLEQAIDAIENYPVTDVEVSYNVDVTDDIYNLANEINRHYLN
tara:strand:- start:1297 stop:1560 length:264 start_codon:yes stop_codon:yes gene_type:complete